MAVVLAVRKWRPYLMGRKFLVRSDQQSLRFLLDQRVIEPEYQKWVSKLLGYEFEIVYKTGASNKAADALSRKTISAECSVMGGPQWRQWDHLRKEVETDPFFMKILNDLKGYSEAHKGFSIQNDLLFYKSRLVIPRTSSLIPAIFEEFHGSQIGGHSGEDRSYQRIASEVFWIGMRKDIADMVKACDTCQHNKNLAGSIPGLLQPIPLPLKLWEEVTMDFIEGLPLSSGYNCIMVVVDRLVNLLISWG